MGNAVLPRIALLVVALLVSGASLVASAPSANAEAAQATRYAHPSTFCKSYLNERNLAAAASPEGRSVRQTLAEARQRRLESEGHSNGELARACLELLNNGPMPPPGNRAAEEVDYGKEAARRKDGAMSRRELLLRQWINAAASP